MVDIDPDRYKRLTNWLRVMDTRIEWWPSEEAHERQSELSQLIADVERETLERAEQACRNYAAEYVEAYSRDAGYYAAESCGDAIAELKELERTDG